MSDQPVAETSAWQHTTLTTDKHTCLSAGFESIGSANERPQTNALDRAATGTCHIWFGYSNFIYISESTDTEVFSNRWQVSLWCTLFSRNVIKPSLIIKEITLDHFYGLHWSGVTLWDFKRLFFYYIMLGFVLFFLTVIFLLLEEIIWKCTFCVLENYELYLSYKLEWDNLRKMD
jgi:hypothetical protein